MTEQQASEEQTSTEEQSQADSPQGTEQQQASGPTSEPKDVKDLPGWAQKLIRDTRKESETYRNRVKEFEDAQKSELDRITGERDSIKAELDTLRTEIRESRAEAAFIEAAKKERARGAKTMFHAAKSELTFDDDGNVTNIAAILARLKKDDPDLFEPTDAPDTDAGRRGQGGSGRKATESAAYQFGTRPV